jgi:hypothetical protein
MKFDSAVARRKRAHPARPENLGSKIQTTGSACGPQRRPPVCRGPPQQPFPSRRAFQHFPRTCTPVAWPPVRRRTQADSRCAILFLGEPGVRRPDAAAFELADAARANVASSRTGFCTRRMPLAVLRNTDCARNGHCAAPGRRGHITGHNPSCSSTPARAVDHRTSAGRSRNRRVNNPSRNRTTARARRRTAQAHRQA